MTDFSC